MITFKDLKVGDKVYIISNYDDVTIQPICDIVKHSYATEFVLGFDPETGHFSKDSFDVFPGKLTNNTLIDVVCELTICASKEAFKAAVESKIKDLKGSIDYYRKLLERVNETTKSCKDCKFYRENPKCMDEILCNEFIQGFSKD